MGLAGGNVLAEEVSIEIDGGIDVLHDCVGAGAETPAPHLIAHGTFTEVSPIMTGPEAAARTHAKRRLAAIVVAAMSGATVVLAAWCVPCRKEMPALDALEGKLGGPTFEVVAVNIDTRDAVKPRAWLKEVGVGRLA